MGEEAPILAVVNRRPLRSVDGHMAELDRVRERLAYFKFWQGVMVVTDISLVGWVVSTAESAKPLPFVLAIVGVACITTGIPALHRRIDLLIDQTGTL
jgi:hypothetical protein